MIEICKTCGRRKPAYYGDSIDRRTANLCRDDRHTESVAVTDNQARDLAAAAKAYNSAKEVEDRATALNDWLAALTDGLPAPEAEQMEMA